MTRVSAREPWRGSRGDLAFYGSVVLVYAVAAVLAIHMTHPAPDRMMVLAERLAQGHLDSPTFAGTVDSVEVGGRYYVAVGVLQLLPYLPFVALPALRGLSAYLVSLAFGIPAAWLALLIARAFGARGRTASWIAWFTAFGTLLFFVSVLGSLYYVAQAEAFLLLELALLELRRVGRRAPTGRPRRPLRAGFPGPSHDNLRRNPLRTRTDLARSGAGPVRAGAGGADRGRLRHLRRL
jgi:hypothetical protein